MCLFYLFCVITVDLVSWLRCLFVIWLVDVGFWVLFGLLFVLGCLVVCFALLFVVVLFGLLVV